MDVERGREKRERQEKGGKERKGAWGRLVEGWRLEIGRDWLRYAFDVKMKEKWVVY